MISCRSFQGKTFHGPIRYSFMQLSHFNDLLQAAAAEPLPQRLLLVFCKAELPDDATPQQRAEFEAGEGGALVPVASVDKFAEAVDAFDVIVAEAQQHGLEWDVLFVAAMNRGTEDANEVSRVDQALEGLVAAIRAGQLGSCLAFNQDGQVLGLA